MYKQAFPFLIFVATGLLLFSCTNPRLQKAGDKGEAGQQGRAGENDSDEIETFGLESLGDTPQEVNDSVAMAFNSATAIDDFISRRLDIAQEYCTMGILANRETAWEEAEYYFEKSLSILGELDIDTESDSLTSEGIRYNRLLAEITANYRTTLVSLGHLPEDVSPEALISRFSEMNNLKFDSSEYKRLEIYTQEKLSYDIPIVFNDRVKKCIVYYQTVARDAVKRYLGRSTKYNPMILRTFAEYGLPLDLSYLALVESGYNPHAYSWARAMGLWQFIASTGRLYNLDRTWWYDERKDPVKATHAAARHLKDLYNEFNSWELALAAYNCGPGRIRTAIKKTRNEDFWMMRLPKQTMDYVPFFMAAVMICKDPARFGFTDINYEPEWRYDEVKINKSLELKTVARAIGRTEEELKELNPELLRQHTPPNVKNYMLRIPVGTKDAFLAAYDEMPSSKQTSWVYHNIRRGESLSTIARKYGVSVYAIREANNLSSKSRIIAGKNLIIPVPGGTTYAEAEPKASRKYAAEGDTYVVRAGDTVSDIAAAFGTTAEEIRRLNRLNRNSFIYVGQRLKVRSDGAEQNAGIRASSAEGASVYVVRKGDTLWDIAKRFGISVSYLRKLNNLGSRGKIYPGQKLLISSADSTSSYRIYTVKRGDTLYGIADQFKTSVAKLLAWNKLDDPSNIKVGERLKIFSN